MQKSKTIKTEEAPAVKIDPEALKQMEAVRKLIAEDPNYQPLLCKSVEDTKESRSRLTTNKDVRSNFLLTC